MSKSIVVEVDRGYTFPEYPKQTKASSVSYYGGDSCWDYILEHDLDFLEGNIIKYITRYKKKGGLRDLQKASNYLNKLIEVQRDLEEATRG